MLFRSGKPFYQTDWANPLVKARLQPDFILAAIQTPSNPFSQTEWPVVRSLARAQGFELSKFQGVDKLFGSAGEVLTYDWTNPRVKPRVVYPDHQVPVGILVVPPTPPFNQGEWIVVRPVARPVRDFQKPFDIVLLLPFPNPPVTAQLISKQWSLNELILKTRGEEKA